MKKKIYFAGSIRGGRNFADLYRKMIEHMQRTDIVLTEHIGQADIVLTEHIGQADINLMEKGRMSDAEIYNQDTAWLQESDMVVAECSNPQLSAMLSGNPYFVIYPYQTEEELFFYG